MLPISYISKILWRFYGGANPQNHSLGIKDIQYIFEGNKIILKPYYGQSGNDKFFVRKVFYEKRWVEPMREDNLDLDLDDLPSIIAKEPKAVCFCDIPINHLPVHMKKYNCVGIGIDRDRLVKKANDLQPVRYYFIKGMNDFNKDCPEVYTVKHEIDGSKIIEQKEYIKIPTLIDESMSSWETKELNGYAPSEGFNSIYEEREWRLFEEVALDFSDISFVLLPKRKMECELGKIEDLLNARVGVIYADELFPEDR